MYKLYKCRLTHEEAWQCLGGRLISFKRDIVLEDIETFQPIEHKDLTPESLSILVGLLLEDLERLAARFQERLAELCNE